MRQLYRKGLVLLLRLDNQLRHPDGIQQTGRHSGSKTLPCLRQHRYPSPQGITGCGVGIIGQRVQKQIGQPMSSQMLTQYHLRGKHQPARIQTSLRCFLVQIRGSGDIVLKQPQHTARYCIQNPYPAVHHHWRDLVVVVETAEHKTLFGQAHCRFGKDMLGDTSLTVVVGGLVLLPKKINASLNDKPYSDKLEHYQSENLLARSLHPMCYVHNPGFLKLKAETGLPLKAFTEFKKANFDERFSLYKGIAELLWSADRLKEVA